MKIYGKKKGTLNFLNRYYIHFFKNDFKYMHFLRNHLIISLKVHFTCDVININ